MKILVISDTHGDIKRAVNLVNSIKGIDMIIHCGDNKRDAEKLAERFPDIEVIAVSGNCDMHMGVDFTIVDTEAGDIFVTHGHDYGVTHNLSEIIEAAKDYDCKAMCFGHTHKPLCVEHDGVLIVNPGSLSEPRGGSEPSCAVITTDGGKFYANIVHYDTVCGDKAERRKSGKLRNMLNYSDGF